MEKKSGEKPDGYVFGRPPKYDNDFHPKEVIRLAGTSDVKVQSVAGICCEFKIAIDTYYDWKHRHPDFSDACKKADALRKNFWIQIGSGLAIGKFKGGNTAAWIFLTKNVTGMKDTPDDAEEGIGEIGFDE